MGRYEKDEAVYKLSKDKDLYLAKSPLPIKILQRNYGKCRWSQDTIVMGRYRKDEAVYKLSRDKDVFSKPCKEPYL